MPLPPNKPTTNRVKKLTSVTLTLAWLVTVGLVVANRQDIIDWWRLRNYQPSSAVSGIARQTSMTDYGRKLFYVNHPAIQAKDRFFDECPNDEREQTIVLGCYHSGRGGIYVLNVSDQRLNGVEEVTSAHEMLHAAYERLAPAERRRVDDLLRNYYNKNLSDARVKQTIEAYKRIEPKDLVNEMHSIFGTELANLPPGLEQYYKQYFKNRAVIVNYAAQYQAVFNSRQASIRAYDAQLELLKTQIDNLQASLKYLQPQLASQRDELDSKRRGGDNAGYNAGVPNYNQLVARYNSEAGQVRGLIARYNQLVAERNNVAREYGELTKELGNDVKSID